MGSLEPASLLPWLLRHRRSSEGRGRGDVPAVAQVPPDAGVPGASLMRTYQTRQASRDKRVREKHPRLGGLLLKLYPESDSAQAFRIGAEGEQQVAARFERSCPDAIFLHNRRRGIGEKMGDIDHIVVAPTGVFVVDPKNYRNAKVSVVRTGLLGHGEERLMVRGRNQSKLIESLRRQKAAVESALDAPQFAGVTVTASFCFIDADLPMFKELTVDSFAILSPRQTVKLINMPGPLTAEQRLAIWNHLAIRLPSA